jgi:hypothetical protein
MDTDGKGVATALPYPVAACCCIIDMNHSENLWRV